MESALNDGMSVEVFKSFDPELWSEVASQRELLEGALARAYVAAQIGDVIGCHKACGTARALLADFEAFLDGQEKSSAERFVDA